MEQKERKKILVVDDEESILDIFKMLLKDDYEIKIETNPKNAYEQIKNDGFDLVISDTEMFIDMSGLDLKKKVNEAGIDIKFIGMSGHDTYKKDWQNLGCYFFTKPFHVKEVYNIITKSLEETLKK